jgi:hypothetical protein
LNGLVRYIEVYIQVELFVDLEQQEMNANRPLQMAIETMLYLKLEQVL